MTLTYILLALGGFIAGGLVVGGVILYKIGSDVTKTLGLK